MSKFKVTTKSGTVYQLCGANGAWTWERVETTDQSGTIGAECKGTIISDAVTRTAGPVITVGQPLWFWTNPDSPRLIKTSRVVKIEILEITAPETVLTSSLILPLQCK